MAKLHRRDLKHDEIRDRMGEAVKSVSHHGREVLYAALAILAVGAIAYGWYSYDRKQQQESQNLLGVALEKFHTSVQQQSPDPNTPKPDYQYKSDEEKYKDAQKDFKQIIEKYGSTDAADIAGYQAGICAFYLKDYKSAEALLKQSAAVSEKNFLYYQARLALANLYNLTSRPQESVKALKSAVEKNRNFVPQDYLLIQLATSYEKAGQTKEAMDTYQKVMDQFKDSPIGYQAQTRLAELKRK